MFNFVLVRYFRKWQINGGGGGVNGIKSKLFTTFSYSCRVVNFSCFICRCDEFPITVVHKVHAVKS